MDHCFGVTLEHTALILLFKMSALHHLKHVYVNTHATNHIKVCVIYLPATLLGMPIQLLVNANF